MDSVRATLGAAKHTAAEVLERPSEKRRRQAAGGFKLTRAGGVFDSGRSPSDAAAARSATARGVSAPGASGDVGEFGGDGGGDGGDAGAAPTGGGGRAGGFAATRPESAQLTRRRSADVGGLRSAGDGGGVADATAPAPSMRAVSLARAPSDVVSGG